MVDIALYSGDTRSVHAMYGMLAAVFTASSDRRVSLAGLREQLQAEYNATVDDPPIDLSRAWDCPPATSSEREHVERTMQARGATEEDLSGMILP